MQRIGPNSAAAVLPLQIKLPLHATAVVLISALAAYIYQKESRQREPGTTAQPAGFLSKPRRNRQIAAVRSASAGVNRRCKCLTRQERRDQIEEFGTTGTASIACRTRRTEQEHRRRPARRSGNCPFRGAGTLSRSFPTRKTIFSGK